MNNSLRCQNCTVLVEEHTSKPLLYLQREHEGDLVSIRCACAAPECEIRNESATWFIGIDPLLCHNRISSHSPMLYHFCNAVKA